MRSLAFKKGADPVFPVGMAEGQQLGAAFVPEGTAQHPGAAFVPEGRVLLPPQAAYPNQLEVHWDMEDLGCRQAARRGMAPAQKRKEKS